MNESVIIQKLIQVGQMLERGELEYSGAEIDTKHYLEQYVALRQTVVMRSVPCANCKEEVVECACMRNKCIRCGNAVGNITFTVCDDCWDKD